MERFICALTMLLLIFASTASEAGENPAAVILSASGTVMVEYGGDSVKSDGVTVLHYGAVVAPQPDSSAIILFRNGKKVTVKKRYKITPENEKIASSASTRSSAATEILFGTFSGNGGNSDVMIGGGISGGLRLLSAESAEEEPAISIDAYINTAIIDQRPTIAWSSTKYASGTVVIVSVSEVGGDAIYKKEAVFREFSFLNALMFPEDATPLKWGTEYKVSVSLKNDPKIEAHGIFSLPPESEFEEVTNLVSDIETQYSDGDSLTVRYMLLTELYINHRLYHEAFAALMKLREVDNNCKPYVMRRTFDLFALTRPKPESDPIFDEIFKQ